MDRFGRKLSEITGIIYISPANDDDSQLTRLTDESIIRNYLFDPSYDGFFYRTDASIVEQWQLWDNDDIIGSRPRPPASPFGLHEGLYHDDTTDEIQRYLRNMDDEEHHLCSCSYSNSSKSSHSTSSISTEHSRRRNRHYSNEQKLSDDSDQYDASFSHLQTSSFEPIIAQNTFETKKSRQAPIIIEKVVPKSVVPIPILNPKLPEQSLDHSNSIEESNLKYVPPSNFSSFSYQINENGEKITKNGNRIVFMDVVQMNTDKKPIDSQSYIPIRPHPRSHRQRSSKHTPVIDIPRIEQLFNEKNSKNQRHISINTDNKSKDQPNHINPLPILDKLETVVEYFEDYYENQMKLNDQIVQSDSSSIKKQRRKSSTTSSTNSSKNETHHRHKHSTLISGPTINYVERPLIPSVTPTQVSSDIKQNNPLPPVLTNEKLNEYVSNIYGIARSIKSSSSSTHQEIKSLDNITVTNTGSIPQLRYMQNSIDRNLLEEYRNAY